MKYAIIIGQIFRCLTKPLFPDDPYVLPFLPGKRKGMVE